MSRVSIVSEHDGGKISEKRTGEVERQRNLLLMAVAYSANIGGTGVITGSPPNLVVPEVCEFRILTSLHNKIIYFSMLEIP